MPVIVSPTPHAVNRALTSTARQQEPSLSDRVDASLSAMPWDHHAARPAIQTTIAEIIAFTTFISYDEDAVLAWVGYLYAVDCHDSHGHWNPYRHLRKDHIIMWVQARNRPAVTRATELAALVRLYYAMMALAAASGGDRAAGQGGDL